jgi:formylglycine-generating enzyme required for sulfatase activity
MGAAPVDVVDGGAGCGDPLADAQPVHRVYVDGFWMDRTEVTCLACTKIGLSAQPLA